MPGLMEEQYRNRKGPGCWCVKWGVSNQRAMELRCHKQRVIVDYNKQLDRRPSNHKTKRVKARVFQIISERRGSFADHLRTHAKKANEVSYNQSDHRPSIDKTKRVKARVFQIISERRGSFAAHLRTHAESSNSMENKDLSKSCKSEDNVKRVKARVFQIIQERRGSFADHLRAHALKNNDLLDKEKSGGAKSTKVERVSHEKTKRVKARASQLIFDRKGSFADHLRPHADKTERNTEKRNSRKVSFADDVGKELPQISRLQQLHRYALEHPDQQFSEESPDRDVDRKCTRVKAKAYKIICERQGSFANHLRAHAEKINQEHRGSEENIKRVKARACQILCQHRGSFADYLRTHAEKNNELKYLEDLHKKALENPDEQFYDEPDNMSENNSIGGPARRSSDQKMRNVKAKVYNIMLDRRGSLADHLRNHADQIRIEENSQRRLSGVKTKRVKARVYELLQERRGSFAEHLRAHAENNNVEEELCEKISNKKTKILKSKVFKILSERRGSFADHLRDHAEKCSDGNETDALTRRSSDQKLKRVKARAYQMLQERRGSFADHLRAHAEKGNSNTTINDTSNDIEESYEKISDRKTKIVKSKVFKILSERRGSFADHLRAHAIITNHAEKNNELKYLEELHKKALENPDEQFHDELDNMSECSIEDHARRSSDLKMKNVKAKVYNLMLDRRGSLADHLRNHAEQIEKEESSQRRLSGVKTKRVKARVYELLQERRGSFAEHLRAHAENSDVEEEVYEKISDRKTKIVKSKVFKILSERRGSFADHLRDHAEKYTDENETDALTRRVSDQKLRRVKARAYQMLQERRGSFADHLRAHAEKGNSNKTINDSSNDEGEGYEKISDKKTKIVKSKVFKILSERRGSFADHLRAHATMTNQERRGSELTVKRVKARACQILCQHRGSFADYLREHAEKNNELKYLEELHKNALENPDEQFHDETDNMSESSIGDHARRSSDQKMKNVKAKVYNIMLDRRGSLADHLRSHAEQIHKEESSQRRSSGVKTKRVKARVYELLQERRGSFAEHLRAHSEKSDVEEEVYEKISDRKTKIVKSKVFKILSVRRGSFADHLRAHADKCSDWNETDTLTRRSSNQKLRRVKARAYQMLQERRGSFAEHLRAHAEKSKSNINIYDTPNNIEHTFDSSSDFQKDQIKRKIKSRAFVLLRERRGSFADHLRAHAEGQSNNSQDNSRRRSSGPKLAGIKGKVFKILQERRGSFADHLHNHAEHSCKQDITQCSASITPLYLMPQIHLDSNIELDNERCYKHRSQFFRQNIHRTYLFKDSIENLSLILVHMT